MSVMLMVADFWGVETRGAGLRACAASTDYGARLIQDGAHESLESTGRGRVARTTTMESC